MGTHSKTVQQSSVSHTLGRTLCELNLVGGFYGNARCCNYVEKIRKNLGKFKKKFKLTCQCKSTK